MDKAKETEKLFPDSWDEYNKLFPEQAKLVKSYEAYRILTFSDHNLFWDEQVYDNLKRALGTDNPVMHPGARLYFSDQQQQKNTRIATNLGRVPGSTSEYNAIAVRQLREYKEELNNWKKLQPVEFEKANELIEVILAGNLNQFDHDKLVEIFKRSVYHFPGIVLSYQIRKNEEDIEEFNKTKNLQHQPTTQRTTTSQQRYEEYLRKQAQKEK